MKTKLDNLIDEIQMGKPGPDTVASEMLSPFRDEFEQPVNGWIVERPNDTKTDELERILVSAHKFAMGIPPSDMCRCHLVPIEVPTEDTDTDTDAKTTPMMFIVEDDDPCEYCSELSGTVGTIAEILGSEGIFPPMMCHGLIYDGKACQSSMLPVPISGDDNYQANNIKIDPEVIYDAMSKSMLDVQEVVDCFEEEDTDDDEYYYLRRGWGKVDYYSVDGWKIYEDKKDVRAVKLYDGEEAEGGIIQEWAIVQKCKNLDDDRFMIANIHGKVTISRDLFRKYDWVVSNNETLR